MHRRNSEKFFGIVPSLKLHGGFSPVAIVSVCAHGHLEGTGNLCFACFVILTDTLRSFVSFQEVVTQQVATRVVARQVGARRGGMGKETKGQEKFKCL